jgi:hypothetical protein
LYGISDFSENNPNTLWTIQFFEYLFHKSYSIKFKIIPINWAISIITILLYSYNEYADNKSTIQVNDEIRGIAGYALLALFFGAPVLLLVVLVEIVMYILFIQPTYILNTHLSYLKYDISVHLDITNHWGFYTFLYVIITFIILFFFSQISNIPNESKFRLIRRLNQETKIASTLLAIYVIFLTICIHLWWMIPITLIWFGYASSLEDKFALVYPSFLLVLSSLLLVLLFYKIRKRMKEVQYIELRDKIKKEILDDLDSNQSIK